MVSSWVTRVTGPESGDKSRPKWHYDTLTDARAMTAWGDGAEHAGRLNEEVGVNLRSFGGIIQR